MKQMADVQTSALVEKSKAEPKNASLPTQIASIYQGAHQFQKAADYYQQALNIDAKKSKRAHANGFLPLLFRPGR
jgi:hypothetical protein